MFRMINPIQAYAWGSTTAFSKLFGWAESAAPQAEVWMGAHPKAPSQIVTEHGPVRLDTHVSEHPEHLGAWGAAGNLPFLLKILAVEAPLSIQAHPTREQAAAGYAAEEAAGIDPDGAERNYVDRNHKPELVVALSDFTALCGFREPHRTLTDLGHLSAVIAAEDAGRRPELVSAIEALSRLLAQEDFHTAVQAALGERSGALAGAAEVLAETNLHTHAPALSPSSADTIERIVGRFGADPGLFVALMLNRVDLAAGQALYLPSGNLHAYLRGTGVEVMANSDNVLRGGLTAKHVDLAELLRVASLQVLEMSPFEPDAEGPGVHAYRPGAEEFALYRIEFPAASSSYAICEAAPVIAVCTQGTVAAGSHALDAGDSVFVPAGEAVQFSGTAAQLFIATAPGEPQREVA